MSTRAPEACCATARTGHKPLSTANTPRQPAAGHAGFGSLPGNLTLVDIESPLGHVAHPPLRLLAAERVEVVDIRGFVRDLKIADTAVTLRTRQVRAHINGDIFKWVAPTPPRIRGDLTSVAAHRSPQTQLLNYELLFPQQDQPFFPRTLQPSCKSLLGLETSSGAGQQCDSSQLPRAPA